MCVCLCVCVCVCVHKNHKLVVYTGVDSVSACQDSHSECKFGPHRYRLLKFGSGGSSRSSILPLILTTMAFKLAHVEDN